ncbi:hypothetical protein GCM10025857_58990 [Alicyclobacillus contaminans]|nr:hypothetical protein GCM10025857_58990 [Alicyclobacillus contaminans]
MSKKAISAIICFVFCVLISFGIQLTSGTLYSQPLAKIDQIEINDQQQDIQATQMNGQDKGSRFILQLNTVATN